MQVLRIVEGLAGAVVVLIVLRDVFQSVVTPRPVAGRWRLNRFVPLGLWRPWRWMAFRLRTVRAREGWLGSFGPLSILISLVTWLLLLVLGYGLLIDSMGGELRPHPADFATALYVAATSLLTIGFGDFVATAGPGRLVLLAAGATGLGVFAMAITFLFSLFAAFQRRETAVVTLEAAAVAPPSGVTLLETYALAHLLGDLPRLFERWQVWAAEVLDSHLAYPILGYFRSSHDNDSWISSLGAVMDATTLVLTTVDIGETPGAPPGLYGWAKLARSVGGHCIEDLVLFFDLDGEQLVGVELQEYRQAGERLRRAGYALRPEAEGWEAFQRLRSQYAGRVNALAAHWASPPAQWIGDRSPLRVRPQHDGHQLVVVPGPVDGEQQAAASRR
jgi:Ion channel